MDSLNFLPGLQHLNGTFIDPMWSDRDMLSLTFEELLVKKSKS